MKHDDDYLWDRSGTPDPEVEQLERTLGRLGARPGISRAPAVPRRRAPRVARWVPLAAAAALVIAAWIPRLVDRTDPEWTVTPIAGLPRAGDTPLKGTRAVGRGAWIETGLGDRARIAIGRIGGVELDPGTRVRIVPTRGRERRIALEHGRLHARIVAPPRRFVVETRAATAVDLGCAYTLEYAAGGRGMLEVRSGWVAFGRDGRESFVPAGARCGMSLAWGPGIPRYQDAVATMAKAIERLESAGPGAIDSTALAATLDAARPRDALTLWHLLSWAPAAERGRVFDRLAALVPPPANVTRSGVLALDRTMLDAWWDVLGLGTASWWRVWEQDA